MSLYEGQGNGKRAMRTVLSGRTAIEIGGVTFYTDGSAIYGLAVARPTAAAAHAALPFAYYVSVDTQAVEQTDGTSWVAV